MAYYNVLINTIIVAVVLKFLAQPRDIGFTILLCHLNHSLLTGILPDVLMCIVTGQGSRSLAGLL